MNVLQSSATALRDLATATQTLNASLIPEVRTTVDNVNAAAQDVRGLVVPLRVAVFLLILVLVLGAIALWFVLRRQHVLLLQTQEAQQEQDLDFGAT